MPESVDYLQQFFQYHHLPEALQKISKPCGILAHEMIRDLDVLPGGRDNPELAVGLRKLLEAKDCFVRAKLVKDSVT